MSDKTYRLKFQVKDGKKSIDPLVVDCELWLEDEDGAGIVDTMTIFHDLNGERSLEDSLKGLKDCWIELWESREEALANLGYELDKEYEV